MVSKSTSASLDQKIVSVQQYREKIGEGGAADL